MQNKLGQTLQSLRTSKKLSLRAVAEKTGLSHGYIRDLELNRNPKTKEPIKPTTETLQKLALAYDYPLTKLIKLAGYHEVADAFQRILDDQEISSKKKELVQMILELEDNDQDLDKIINVLKALK